MSTQAALEEQVFAALLDVNDARLLAHTGSITSDLDVTYAAFENLISHARKGKAALDQLLDLKCDEELETWQDEHDENDCNDDPNCDRDHGAERADSAAETRWEIARDWA